MSETSWQVEGDYFETCNCDFLCPCISSNLQARPTKGDCKVAMVFQVTKGHYGGTALDGLSFVVVALTPGPMIEGNWTVGLIVDERASDTQRDALAAIASGEAGGPMAVLAPMTGMFAGVIRKPIHIDKEGLSRKVSVPDTLEEGLEGLPTMTDPAEPIVIDNTAHPANARLALAKASHSHLHAFGIDWDDDSGANNGHFAEFSWQSA
ncbi:MAG: DUF1326 domain-containing protein [Pseudomonadota bacterium]